MDGIKVVPCGDCERKGQELIDGNESDLLYYENGVEAVIDLMPKGTVGIYSPTQKGTSEIYYVISGKIAVYDCGKTLTLAAGDFYSLHEFDRFIMFEVIETSKEIYVSNCPYFDTNESRISSLINVLSTLQQADGDTLSHCERVKTLSMHIARCLHFDQKQLRALLYASRFHDVGKSKIPLDILLKPGRLTSEEYDIMKQHSRFTYEMILDQFGEDIAEIAYEHHERLDGGGYPRGLLGEQIGLPARIICVADAYDAMVTTRPYHIGKTSQDAVAELHRSAVTQFDPLVISALCEYLQERHLI